MPTCGKNGLPARYASSFLYHFHAQYSMSQGVIKTYKLTYESVEVVHAIFNKDAAKNKWKIGAHVLRSWIEHFGVGTEHLDICSENGRVSFMSYTEKIMNESGLLHDGYVGIRVKRTDCLQRY